MKKKAKKSVKRVTVAVKQSPQIRLIGVLDVVVLAVILGTLVMIGKMAIDLGL